MYLLFELVIFFKHNPVFITGINLLPKLINVLLISLKSDAKWAGSLKYNEELLILLFLYYIFKMATSDLICDF